MKVIAKLSVLCYFNHLQYPFVRLFEVAEGKRSFCTNLKKSVTLQRVTVASF